MGEIITAIGMMSGTSLDGIDVSIIDTDGETLDGRDQGISYEYTAEERQRLADFTEMARAWNFQEPPPNAFADASLFVDSLHARALTRFRHDVGLQQTDASVIGYHGQTVLHDATRGRTLQLANGDSLAYLSGIPVVYDFRSADVAAGGEGAPLAPIYHQALVERSKLTGVTAVLNLGGVGNISIIDGDRLLASDTGPANGPLDSWLDGVDVSGRVSQAGTPDFALVEDFLRVAVFPSQLAEKRRPLRLRCAVAAQWQEPGRRRGHAGLIHCIIGQTNSAADGRQAGPPRRVRRRAS